ncbi:hypothetical protein RQP46_001263 [Phenoliferia psychrophenolica]
MGFKIVEDKDTPQEIYNSRIYLVPMVQIVIAFSSCLFGYCASFIGTTITTYSFMRDFGLDTLSTSDRSSVSANIISLQVIAVVFIISAILQTVATTQLGLIYAGRVIAGLCVGGVTCCAPVYLAELSPPAIRGRLVGFYEISYQIAAVVGFWINYGIVKTIPETNSISWRIPMAVQLIPGGLLLFTSFYLKESPRYLLKMQKPELASRNLCFLRNLPADHPYIEAELSATVVQINREREVTAKHEGNQFQKYCRGMWHEVSAKGIRNRLIIGAFIMMWQNMSGINAINFYSPTLFKEIGVSDTSLYTGIYGVLKALASLVFFAFLVDTWGRRPPLFFGGIASGLSLLYVAIYIKVGHPDTATAAGVAVSASTAAGGKAATAGITLWQWIFQFIIARETPDMSATLGWGMFLLFAMFNFASVIFVFL